MMWNKARIESEHKMKERFGLKNIREYWMAASELRRIRRNTRAVLSGNASEKTGKEMISRLAKYDVVKPEATLDDLLVIEVERLLDRRLQSVVFRRSLAKSMAQARQLITHGFISVGGKRVTSPGYMVRRDEEGSITYYKPFKLEAPVTATAPGAKPAAAAPEATAVPAAPAAPAAKAEKPKMAA